MKLITKCFRTSDAVKLQELPFSHALPPHRLGPVLSDSSGRRVDKPLSIDLNSLSFQQLSKANLCSPYHLLGKCAGDCGRTHLSRPLSDHEFDSVWFPARQNICHRFRDRGNCNGESASGAILDNWASVDKPLRRMLETLYVVPTYLLSMNNCVSLLWPHYSKQKVPDALHSQSGLSVDALVEGVRVASAGALKIRDALLVCGLRKRFGSEHLI